MVNPKIKIVIRDRDHNRTLKRKLGFEGKEKKNLHKKKKKMKKEGVRACVLEREIKWEREEGCRALTL